MNIDSKKYFIKSYEHNIININYPISKLIPYTKFKGIKNNGNTCFFNSALQLLNSMELFRNYFIKIDKDDCDLFSCALKTFFTLMEIEDNKPIDLINITLTHKNEKKTLLNILTEDFYNLHEGFGGMYDCSEYLIKLLSILVNVYDKNFNNIHVINRLSRLYEFNIIDMRNCRDYSNSKRRQSLHRSGQPTNTYHIYLLLKINVDKDNLQNLINNYFSIKQQDKEYSGNCSKLLEKVRDENISYDENQFIPILNDCNRYIIISLNRRKNLSNEYEKKNYSIIPNDIIHIRNRNYKLISLAMHVNNNHYITVIFDDLGNSFLLNDEEKTKTSKYLDSDRINTNGVIFIYCYNGDTSENTNIKYLENLDLSNNKFINLKLLSDDIKIKENINACEFPTQEENFMIEKNIGPKKVLNRCKSKYYKKYLKYKNKYLELSKYR
jgi:hypothetical protein